MSKLKKKWIAVVAMGLSISLVACGQTKEITQTTEQTEEGQSQTESDEENSAKETEAKDLESSENTDDVSVDDSASMDRYEKFLAGNEKMFISKVNLGMDSWGDFTPSLQADGSYTIEEFLQAFFADRAGYYMQSYTVNELDYAYVDCGQDGRKELALNFYPSINGEEYSVILLVKDVNGRLELCFWTEDGYRSFNRINQDGIISRGGSGGASNWYDSSYGIDGEGNSFLIYEQQTCGCYDLCFNDVDFGEIASNLDVDDISILRYSFDGYNAEEYDEESYKKYMEDCYYSYTTYPEPETADEIEAFYGAKSKYTKFMNLVTDNLYKPDEMEKVMAEKLAEKGVSLEMLEYDEPTWTKWEGHEEMFAATQYEAPAITVINPAWQYYTTPYPYFQQEDFVTMDEISHVANDIIDDYEWFDEIGVTMPERGVIEDPSTQYTYYLSSTYGQYEHEYDTVRVHNNWTGMDEAILDFYNFIMPDEYAAGDAPFVNECVNYLQAVDGVLYVSISHSTYAASAPHNAYVMALDMNDDYKVIWKSEPLVSNAKNFAIVDGSLICGYGFTDEPDYIYELNRYTGEKMNTVKVKTGPDYFYVIDGKLYVRTYNTNYVYQLGWG